MLMYKWNTKKVTNIGLMFYNSKVNNLDLSRWMIKALTNMNAMFYGCRFLSNLFKWFTTPNVNNMMTAL